MMGREYSRKCLDVLASLRLLPRSFFSIFHDGIAVTSKPAGNKYLNRSPLLMHTRPDVCQRFFFAKCRHRKSGIVSG